MTWKLLNAICNSSQNDTLKKLTYFFKLLNHYFLPQILGCFILAVCWSACLPSLLDSLSWDLACLPDCLPAFLPGLSGATLRGDRRAACGALPPGSPPPPPPPPAHRPVPTSIVLRSWGTAAFRAPPRPLEAISLPWSNGKSSWSECKSPWPRRKRRLVVGSW